MCTNTSNSTAAIAQPAQKDVAVEAKKDEEEAMNQEADRKNKLKILLENLTPLCTEASEHEQLRKLGRALANRDELTGTVLSGGYTNYSYKVFLASDPDVAVFAKVGFTYAIWAPDHSVHYDLGRLTTEYECMKRFSKVLGKDDPCVATPFALIDIAKDTRALVAEWVAPADEQWAHQFIEGEIDERPLKKCARALAGINLTDCPDPDINKGFVDSFREICSGLDDVYLELLDRPDSDRAIEYAKRMSRGGISDMMKGWHMADESQECLVHGDAHVFNMMVERKPDMSELENFGTKGKLYICDWEMVNKGDKGNDVGRFMSYPILSAGFLASRGHGRKADEVVDTVRRFWEEYKCVMVDEGKKTEEELAAIFLASIGYCGFFSTFVFYLCRYFFDYNNTDGLTETEADQVMASNGLLGLKMMEMCYVDYPTKSLPSLKELEEEFFSGLVNKELRYLENTIGAGAVHRMGSRRRSSMLRFSERRASDSAFGLVVRRLSPNQYDIEQAQ